MMKLTRKQHLGWKGIRWYPTTLNGIRCTHMEGNRNNKAHAIPILRPRWEEVTAVTIILEGCLTVKSNLRRLTPNVGGIVLLHYWNDLTQSGVHPMGWPSTEMENKFVLCTRESIQNIKTTVQVIPYHLLRRWVQRKPTILIFSWAILPLPKTLLLQTADVFVTAFHVPHPPEGHLLA